MDNAQSPDISAGNTLPTHGLVHKLSRGGMYHAMKPGDVVHAGDIVATEKGGEAQLLLPDGSILSAGQNEAIVLNRDFAPTKSGLADGVEGAASDEDGDHSHHFVRLLSIAEELPKLAPLDVQPTTSLHYSAFIDDFNAAGGLPSIVNTLLARGTGGVETNSTTGLGDAPDSSSPGSGGDFNPGGSGETGGDSEPGQASGSTSALSGTTSNSNSLPSNPIVVTPIPGITINPIATLAGSDTASNATIAIGGTVSRSVPVGNIVTVSIDGHVYTGMVQDEGIYSVEVPAAMLAGAAVDTVYASVHVGGPGSPVMEASESYDVAPGGSASAVDVGVEINPVPLVNAAGAASAAPIAVTGTVNCPAGITVSVTVGGHTYTGSVGANGTFSVGVPGDVLAGASGDTLKVSVSGTDAAGNGYRGSATQSYMVDVSLPTVSITIDPIAAISASASASSAPVVIRGTVSDNVPVGDAVTITVGGHNYIGTVTASGIYSVVVPGNALGNAHTDTLEASVSVTNAAGNVGTATASQVYTVVTAAEFGIEINPIATINGAEAVSPAPIAIAGAVSGNDPGGDLVTLTVGGHSYTGVAQANGSYSIGVPGDVLAAAADHSVSAVSVSITGGNGHAATASATQSYDVELRAPPISISVEALSPLTAAQAQGDAAIAIEGTVSANVALGTVVTANVDGHSYSGTVQAGDEFSIAIPGDVLGGASSGNIVVSVSAVDAAGNTASASADLSYAVAPTPPAVSISVNPIPTVTVSEAAGGAIVAITGNVSSDVPAGAVVTVTVDGHSFTGAVASDGGFQVDVPGGDLALGAQGGLQASVSVIGAGGALGTATASLSYGVDIGSSAVVTVDPLPVVNGAVAAGSNPVAVAGEVGSNVPTGTLVTVSVGGQSYSGTVQDGGGFSVDVPGNVLGSASTDSIQVSVAATASTTATVVTQPYTVELSAAPISVTIEPIAAVSATEAASAAPVVFQGSVSSNVPAGTAVALTVDGNTYLGTVQQGGGYSIGVPGTVLAASSTDSVHIGISATDAAGNTADASADLPYTVAASAASIDMTVAPIPTINGAQAASSAPIDIMGTISASVPVTGDVVSVTVGDTAYTGTVQANGGYSVAVPGNALASAGSVQVVVTAADGSGHVSSSSITEPISVELTAPPIGVSIDPIATINGMEAAGSVPVAITGTLSSNVPAGTVITVSVDGQSYTGTAQADGTYSVGVPGNVLANAATDSVQVSVATVDAAGNTASASDSQAYSVELNAPSIGIGINTIATINGAEAASSAAIAVAGSVSGNVPAGTTVTLSVAGQSYTGAVQADGSYSIGVPGNLLAAAPNDSIHASVGTTDAAGNSASATADLAYAVELSAPAIGIGIDQIAPITLAEAAGPASVVITGTVSSNVGAGETVTLLAGGNTYTGTVAANHTYSIGVPGNVLAGAAEDTVQASISSTDAAGNTAAASASESYSVYNSSIAVEVALTTLPIINAAMAGSADSIMVGGTVSSNVPAGDSVTLSVDGHTYTAAVQAGGAFSVGIPGNVLAGAAIDSIAAGVSITEPNGQVVSGTGSLAYTVELAAAPIAIAINQLDTVNALDALSAAPIAVTGSVSSNVPAGTGVVVSVGSQSYTGAVQADGTYSVNVPGNVLADASNDTVNASISSTDAAGNTASASASQAYTVELAAAAISVTLDPVAVINASVAASAGLVAIAGAVSANVPVGETVTLTVDGQSYSGLVLAGGTFSIGVPGDVLGAAASVHAGVSYTDAAGNTASAGITQAYTVELAAPPVAVAVDPIVTINAAIAASADPVEITGSVSADVSAGTAVTATVDGHLYSGTVLANGTFGIAVPGNALGDASSDTVTVALAATDAAGNTATASETVAYTVELTAAPIALSINAIATINGAEAASNSPIAVTGTVSSNVPAGDVVTVSVGGNTYTGTVTAGGEFSVGVPGSVLAAASSDSLTASVSATDAAGNTAGASAALTYAVELTAAPIGIGINAIATINAAEAASSDPIAIAGTVSSNVPAGDIVTLSVGGSSYTGTVSAGGTYSIGVPGDVLASAGSTMVEASISLTDAAGNVATGTASETYSVNTVAPSINIAVDPILTINAAAAGSANLIAITGEVSANVPAGDLVTLTAGGQTYTGIVTAGSTFSIGVPGNVLGAAASDSVTATVSATDSSGNVGTASVTTAYTVELTAPPINIGIDPIATINGIIGSSSAAVAVTGTVSGDVPAGTVVTLSVGGSSYTGVLTAQDTYSIGIPGNVLAAAVTDSIHASVSATDAAGNTASASASLSYSVELSGAPVSISIDPIATINAAMAASSAAIAVAGSVGANVPIGDTVTLTVAGDSFTGTVTAGGTYRIGIPGDVLAAAASDTVSASVSVTDAAGNVSNANASLAYNVELSAPPISITIDPIVTINGAMAASSAPVLITGTVSANVPAGTQVSLAVAGNLYSGLVLAGGIYSIGVPGSVLAGASSDSVQVSVSTTDAAGNVASTGVSRGYTVELAAPLISISINPIGVLTSALSGNVLSITGSVSSNVPVGTLITLNVGGGTYTGEVQPGGGYSIGVPGLVLLASVLDIVQVAVSFTDPAGNVASANASQGYTVDLLDIQSDAHRTASLAMHIGHIERNGETVSSPQHGHSLHGLLGGDKFAYSLAPHREAADHLPLQDAASRLPLHMSDLLTDRQAAHHVFPHLPALLDHVPANASHVPNDLMLLHSLSVAHDSLLAHTQWHRAAGIE